MKKKYCSNSEFICPKYPYLCCCFCPELNTCKLELCSNIDSTISIPKCNRERDFDCYNRNTVSLDEIVLEIL